MKNKYIELMEKALSAYSDEHISDYFNRVKTHGLNEHGFPRLTANLGILIAHGYRHDLFPLFLEMMDFCCEQMPKVIASNDFTVREIVCCISEFERTNNLIDKNRIQRWKNWFSQINPETCYSSYATSLIGKNTNWALFMMVSELFRANLKIREDATDFIDQHLVHQLKWFDENGMYKDFQNHDSTKETLHQPFLYDLVSRGLCCLLINFGYRGKYYQQIDEFLKKAGLLSLKMQSPNGEVPFGGRSNCFIHNEAWLITIYEYEAKRYAKEGNLTLASTFKSHSAKALEITEYWLSKKPIRHIKNRFPTETKYGCEDYAYFDKYMITVASFLYTSYLICDESIAFTKIEDEKPCVFATSKYFHKLFLKSGGYGLEFDINADLHYDANGLGRVHKNGAPSPICLSTPCPLGNGYLLDIEKKSSFSACSAVKEDGVWLLGAEKTSKYEILKSGTDERSAFATLLCKFNDDRSTTESYNVNSNGVCVAVEGNGEIGFALPAFNFDGKTFCDLKIEKRALTVFYEGWKCTYETDGEILDLQKIVANRNGHYRAFIATAKNQLNVNIKIAPNR